MGICWLIHQLLILQSTWSKVCIDCFQWQTRSFHQILCNIDSCSQGNMTMIASKKLTLLRIFGLPLSQNKRNCNYNVTHLLEKLLLENSGPSKSSEVCLIFQACIFYLIKKKEKTLPSYTNIKWWYINQPELVSFSVNLSYTMKCSV